MNPACKDVNTNKFFYEVEMTLAQRNYCLNCSFFADCVKIGFESKSMKGLWGLRYDLIRFIFKNKNEIMFESLKSVKLFLKDPQKYAKYKITTNKQQAQELLLSLNAFLAFGSRNVFYSYVLPMQIKYLDRRCEIERLED